MRARTVLVVLTAAATASWLIAVSGASHRWYSPDLVDQGRSVFQANCGQCHGMRAEGLAGDWRKPLADGSYPPPPLNGTAHAWHHPMSQLLGSIGQGGVRFGGKMPGFADKLSKQEALAAIAYFQSFWSDEIYRHWLGRGGVDL